MPSFSSLLGSDDPPERPICLILQRPDSDGNAMLVSVAHQPVAQYNCKKSVISRAGNPICTFKRSSLSGTTTLKFGDREVKMRQSSWGLGFGKDIDSPIGNFTWSDGSGGFEELRDRHKTLLARGKLPGTFRSKPSDLEVFVPGDDLFLLDSIVCSWLSWLAKKGDEDDEEEAVWDVLGHVFGF